MEQTNKRPLVILTGPTAVGKTAASIGLAKAIGGEIISADSMQVYREMDIGSAKIRPEEMDGVPHHLVDVLDPSEDFNVVLFQQMAKEANVGSARGNIISRPDRRFPSTMRRNVRKNLLITPHILC